MKIRVIDDLHPEDCAMLQALYSRSAESVDIPMKKVEKVGSGKFMDQYVRGYGHKSIADCGTTTIFIEDVSLLTAKAFQDWPLYNGQETSTRYIDMAKQRIVDPVDSPLSKKILEKWMYFYVTNQSRVAQLIRERYPRKDGEEEDKYEKAVKARVFDSLRGFLPAGITTQFSWHTNLRQGGDHLAWLIHHPSPEIREVARWAQAVLAEKYPSSGMGTSIGSGTGSGNQDVKEAWKAKIAEQYTYVPVLPPLDGYEGMMDSHLNDSELEKYQGLFDSRPQGCEIPHFLTDLGQIQFDFLLDFGSHRDIQRHRNGVCRMPLLTTEYGFESWYLEQLDFGMRDGAEQLIEDQMRDIERVTDNPVLRQYYTALGFRVATNLTYALPAAVYVMELRSGKHIHPSLRRKVQWMIREFKAQYPNVSLHVDTDLDDWTVRRGSQTITEKT
jgi:hypothetical protein